MGAAAGVLGGFAAITSISAASQQADALRVQGDYQKSMFEVNSKFAELKGREAIRLGDKTADQIQSGAERFVGTQRTAAAAAGVDVNSGSAATLQQDTRMQAEVAAMTVKNNAWREAWGYKVEATNASFAGKFASYAANNSASSTLLTGGINALTYLAPAFAKKGA